jgi:pyruvate/2-oxoglutarate dehydrogenase complex dihydrolipoamide acyltransferase (E2) component
VLFRLELPTLSAGAHTLEVTRWHKEVGDDVAFGDLLCELNVLEKRVLGRGPAAGLRTRPVVGLEYLIRSSDTGIIRELTAPVGTNVTPGDLLALLSTNADEPLDPTQPATPFRVAGDYRADTELPDGAEPS